MKSDHFASSPTAAMEAILSDAFFNSTVKPLAFPGRNDDFVEFARAEFMSGDTHAAVMLAGAMRDNSRAGEQEERRNAWKRLARYAAGKGDIDGTRELLTEAKGFCRLRLDPDVSAKSKEWATELDIGVYCGVCTAASEYRDLALNGDAVLVCKDCVEAYKVEAPGCAMSPIVAGSADKKHFDELSDILFAEAAQAVDCAARTKHNAEKEAENYRAAAANKAAALRAVALKLTAAADDLERASEERIAEAQKEAAQSIETLHDVWETMLRHGRIVTHMGENGLVCDRGVRAIEDALRASTFSFVGRTPAPIDLAPLLAQVHDALDDILNGSRNIRKRSR
jgi:hypothetical protein